MANNIYDYFQYSSVSGRTINTNTNITNMNTKDELKNIIIDVNNNKRENNMSGNNFSKFEGKN